MISLTSKLQVENDIFGANECILLTPPSAGKQEHFVTKISVKVYPKTVH